MIGLWNEQTAAEATGGEARGLWHASRLEIDSRRVQLGDLFVAIKASAWTAIIMSRKPCHAVRWRRLFLMCRKAWPRSAPLIIVKIRWNIGCDGAL